MAETQDTITTGTSNEEKTSWWKTTPAILGAIGTFITAITGLLIALQQTGVLGAANKPSLQLSQQMGALDIPQSLVSSARVDSPNDGFLALRTEPTTRTGARIMKIPQGEKVSVTRCGGYITSGDRRGRWCWVTYKGTSGWAFDAFLIYD
jgi:hypothetical protein